jgi:membrane protease YdiL (CAAX protease family)
MGENARIGKSGQSNEPTTTAIVIAVFFFSIYGKRLLTSLGLTALGYGSPFVQLAIGYLFWVIPSLITLLLIYEFDVGRVLRELGLKANALKSILFALLATAPMFLGYALMSRNPSGDISPLVKEALLPGIFEEYIFRGYLVGQLFKRGRLGFIPAVLISSVVFAIGHLYQGGSMIESLGIVLITSLGSAWFAWIFVEWGRNLYLIMALHTFMNLWWSAFGAGDNGLGGATANIFRFVTVAITIIVTIIRCKKTQFRVSGGNLFLAPGNL